MKLYCVVICKFCVKISAKENVDTLSMQQRYINLFAECGHSNRIEKH